MSTALSCSAVARLLTSRRSSHHTWPSEAARRCSEALTRLLHHLLSLVLSSGAFAHVKALIISHVAVRGRHVLAARLPFGCFISAVTRAQQWRVCSRQVAHHITRGRQWAARRHAARRWPRQTTRSIMETCPACTTYSGAYLPVAVQTFQYELMRPLVNHQQLVRTLQLRVAMTTA
jgi:hypothetical protein